MSFFKKLLTSKKKEKKEISPVIWEFTPEYSRARERVIAVVAILWALFQMLLPQAILLDSITTRSIHLAFALILAYLTTSFIIKKKKDSSLQKILKYIWLIALIFLSLYTAMYIKLEWGSIINRLWNPNTLDIITGVTLIVVLLEAVRRKVWAALSIIVILFSIYVFTASYMPEFLAFKQVSISKYITQITLSTEGIYGIPLGISASTIYLFVLLWALLEKAWAGKFFIDLSLSLLGKYRWWSAKAAVVSSGLIGTITWSSIANVVTSWTFTIPLMKKTWYPAKKAAAIEVAASTDGQIIPPIMGAAAFIIAEYVNISYMEVAKAALIPAIASMAALFFITHLEACKLGIEGLKKKYIPNFLKTLMWGFHYLLVIWVLIYELFYLRHTPELAAYNSILLLIAIIFLQEIWSWDITKKWCVKSIKKALKIITKWCINGSKNMIIVALATAAAGIIVGLVTLWIGGMIAQIVETLSYWNIYLLLGITAIASLILWIWLPTTATYIVMASLTAPLIVNIWGDYWLVVPLIAAHLFCFYFWILADDTPPVWLAAYAAASIAKSDPIQTGLQSFSYDIRTAILPFMFILNTDILLYNISNWYLWTLIFAMTIAWSLMFTSALQWWFFIKNRFYEFPFFLFAALIFFHPGSVANIFDLWHYKYYFYLLGILIVWLLCVSQKYRKNYQNVSL